MNDDGDRPGSGWLRFILILIVFGWFLYWLSQYKG